LGFAPFPGPARGCLVLMSALFSPKSAVSDSWTPPSTFDFELVLSDFNQVLGCAPRMAPIWGVLEVFWLIIRISSALHPLCFVVNQALHITGNVGHGDFDCGAGQTNGPDF